jgi:hypothetical protein
MNVQLDIEITATERQAGDLVFVEGRASDGSQAAFYLRVSALGGQLPQVGQHLALTVSSVVAASAGAPATLRERMQGGRPVTTAGAAWPSSAPPMTATRAPTSVAQDPSGMLLSSILGNTPTGAAISERDVEDEMNALLGPPRRKG